MIDVRGLLGARGVVLAPMAGVTEAPFRGICKRMGARLTYTEMVSAKGLHYNPDSRASAALLTFSAEETPCAVQLFGSEPEMMAEQAALLVAKHAEKIALIDINMGCPVSKVVAKGEGSALMRDPERAARIVSSVVDAVPLPVTVKFRRGWDLESANAVEFALAMQDAGASAVAVHGRTRSEFYRGQADWECIARVKAAVAIPVLGSGDVFGASDCVRMFEETGADAVMVARGAQGNPWIFREARALIDRDLVVQRPTPAERLAVAREHARALVDVGGERAVVRMRKHLGWYLSEMPAATKARARINECSTYAEIEALLDDYAAYLHLDGSDHGRTDADLERREPEHG